MTTSCWSAARRSTRPLPRTSAPTPIAATPPSRSRPPRPSWPSDRARSPPSRPARPEHWQVGPQVMQPAVRLLAGLIGLVLIAAPALAADEYHWVQYGQDGTVEARALVGA